MVEVEISMSKCLVESTKTNACVNSFAEMKKLVLEYTRYEMQGYLKTDNELTDEERCTLLKFRVREVDVRVNYCSFDMGIFSVNFVENRMIAKLICCYQLSIIGK